ncbi:MFS general substrate transporter [Jaminaea rosea]|uniref:MFS general substrate transporter n=1 Tax=Jaminaea rosea TaxID=1569628 RepID=A0A316UT37_9BASI|nr:MFS general substrate transporter [Jaminaea rosea]PWN28432.1 MFS general substrate transporter [Jaminaea rosea]
MVTIEAEEAKQIDFPDGGREAWLVVAGAWSCSFVSWGYVNAFGVLAEYYLRTILADKTSSEVAWISSLQYCLIFAVGLFTGRLFDMGYFRPTILVGMVLWVFTQMMTSLCKEYWQFILAQGFGLGISFGIVFSLSVAVPAQWFSRRRATAFGILATGSSMGGVIFPIMINKLLPQVGFGWTMRIVGFIGVGMLTFSWFTLKTRLPPSIDVKAVGWKNVRFFDPAAFKMPAFTFFCLGSTLVLFGLYTPFTYIDIWTSRRSLPIPGYYLSILNAASIFGRIIPGILADHIGRMNCLLPMLWLSAVFVFIFPLCDSIGALIVFSILFGFSTGAYVSLIPASVAQLGPTASYGTRLGMLFMAMSIGGLLGTPISGAILGDGQGDAEWWKTMGYAGAMVVGGCVSITVARQLALKSWKPWGKI